ncbi:bile acid:sodium symporter family protein [Oceanicaulis sp. MMSF_3324]|uniref:bile acid:sodium symporter family protein n=1 Tax=Oceanicaulis sp. MMSF_3324 TaxID=3046702 RepID=UPI00273ECE08|nr:bile acid:sodium symporter [Oceanicaulis sp. MMSF_3324]
MDLAALDAVQIELAPGAQLIMPVILVAVMFGVALDVHLKDFALLKARPLRFIGAAAAQIIGLPLVTLGLILVLSPPPSIALGMIVVACCPGGNVSNFLTHLAKGDIALSVSLTATSSLAAALLTPVSIVFWTSLYGPADALVDTIDVSPVPFVVQTTLLLAVPLISGMLIAHHYPRTARRLRPIFLMAGLLGLAVLIIGGVGSNWALFTATAGSVLVIAMIHNATAFVFGAASARALGFETAGRRSVTFEVGIQNTGLGLVILLGQFEGVGGAAAITALWAVWHLFSGGMLVGFYRGLDWARSQKSAETAP